MTIGSLRVDRVVVHSVLAVIQPAGIEAAIKLSECAQAEDDEKRKALTLRLADQKDMVDIGTVTLGK